MEAVIVILFQVLPFVVFISLGIFIGKRREKNHFIDLERREAELKDQVFVCDLRIVPEQNYGSKPPTLLFGEAVIATDYLKSLLTSFRHIFGGEMRSAETLAERARREAICRLLEDARNAGYDAVANLRVEGADIGGNTTSRKKAIIVGILATGTGYNRRPANV